MIVDEPTTGLDPRDMAEMRDLIRSLGRGARTVLLSSHLRSGIEQICERAGMIRKGELVAEGTIEELTGPEGCSCGLTPLSRQRR